MKKVLLTTTALIALGKAPAIAAAVNRYFGYLLVNEGRLSAEPFTPGSGAKRQETREPSQNEIAKVGAAVEKIDDEELKAALRDLGLALAGRSERKDG